MRYYHNHLIISSAMCFAGCVAVAILGLYDEKYFLINMVLINMGALFYGFREVIQYHQKKWWDAKGFWWGVAPAAVTTPVYLFFGGYGFIMTFFS